MIYTFVETLKPMLALFIFIALGFILVKFKVLPENSSKVLAKLLTFAICPALSFSAMAKYFTINNFVEHFINLLLGSLSVGVALIVTFSIVGFFVKDKRSYERNIYKYALTIGNMGYVGEPLVIALFGMEGLAYYKIAVLPFSILIYTWGINILVPKGESKSSLLKMLLNPPTLFMFIGMIAGISGFGSLLYSTEAISFIPDVIDGLGGCMGPVAMLLAGVTIAKYNVKKMLTNKKIYVASIFRLVFIPAVVIAVMFGVISLINLIPNIAVDNSFLFWLYFCVATPLGMNTIVFPEAYGGDPSTGAGMTTISHTLCVITIPLTYALLVLLVGPAPVF